MPSAKQVGIWVAIVQEASERTKITAICGARLEDVEHLATMTAGTYDDYTVSCDRHGAHANCCWCDAVLTGY
jgi:hypothetical protein